MRLRWLAIGVIVSIITMLNIQTFAQSANVPTLKTPSIIALETRINFSGIHKDRSAENKYLEQFLNCLRSLNNEKQTVDPEKIKLLIAPLANDESHLKTNSLEQISKKALEEAGQNLLEISSETAKTYQEKTRPFYTHTKDAIELNKRRKKYYASVSNGKTNSLSQKLIRLEYCMIPTALLFDKWAKNLRRKGYPVLIDDFVPMTGIAPKAKKPVFTNIPTKEATKQQNDLVNNYIDEIKKKSLSKEFLSIAESSRLLIKKIKQLQISTNAHFPMCLHLIESIGLAAKNAALWSKKSQTKTDLFYQTFIGTQIIGLRLFMPLDKDAHIFHSQGIGILINDIPDISF